MPLAEFLYGCAYYPEHWEETTRADDPAWMRDAGFNCVRMGEFAWDLFEREEGVFDFSFHAEEIERLATYGIRTILCTPTAAQPSWLTRLHPEIQCVDADGRPLQHGSRQHASHLNPIFREYSRRITQAMADHFRGNPHVIGWQTDNEIHCHFSEDHSEAAVRGFQEFLQVKYAGDIRVLNQEWGTAFWAQTYGSFGEIPTPKQARPTWVNPAHALDYKRFLSHGAAMYQRDQVEILRAADPRWFITHNGCFANIDYRGDFTRDLDFLGYDVYPFFDPNPRTRRFSQAFNLDYVRAYSGNIILLEQQSGPGGQGDYFHDQPEPDEMRRMAWSSIARGADSLLFFRERSCRFGAEEYWCGILDHDNIPRRRFAEARQMGAELRVAGPALLGTHVHVDVGVATSDFDVDAAHAPMSLGLPTPKKMGESVHGFFFGRGYATGCVHPADDLSGLAVYVIPHFAVFDPSWVPNLERYVAAGGILVIGARTASKDLKNNVVAETLPGVLRSLIGATVEEYSRQNCPDVRRLDLVIGEKRARITWWYEALRCDPETKSLGTWGNRHLAGSTAVTLRQIGKGVVLYVGTYFDVPVLEALLPSLQSLPGWPKTLPGWQDGLEIVCRTDGVARRWFYINHNDEAVSLTGTVKGTDLLDERRWKSSLDLAPHGVAFIEEDPAGVPLATS